VHLKGVWLSSKSGDIFLYVICRASKTHLHLYITMARQQIRGAYISRDISGDSGVSASEHPRFSHGISTSGSTPKISLTHCNIFQIFTQYCAILCMFFSLAANFLSQMLCRQYFNIAIFRQPQPEVIMGVDPTFPIKKDHSFSKFRLGWLFVQSSLTAAVCNSVPFSYSIEQYHMQFHGKCIR